MATVFVTATVAVVVVVVVAVATACGWRGAECFENKIPSAGAFECARADADERERERCR